MADYHQACIRAAAADYCANGTSFTKDGTLIDIYDYQPHQSYAAGFVPRTLSLHYQDADPPTAPMIVFTLAVVLAAVRAVPIAPASRPWRQFGEAGARGRRRAVDCAR